MKYIELTDIEKIQAIQAIQDRTSGLPDGPLIGSKRLGGRYVPLDEIPGYTPEQWKGTTEIYAIECVGKLHQLTLTGDMADRISKAKAKPSEARTDEEKILAAVTV